MTASQCHHKCGRSKSKTPNPGQCIFFSGFRGPAQLQAAEAYAELKELKIVALCYPKHFVEKNQHSGTPNEKYQFQKNFSRVFAESAINVAYLMIDDDKVPTPNSIFMNTELPILRANGTTIKRIPFINPLDDPTSATRTF